MSISLLPSYLKFFTSIMPQMGEWVQEIRPKAPMYFSSNVWSVLSTEEINVLNKLGLSCAKLRTSFAEIGLAIFQLTG